MSDRKSRQTTPILSDNSIDSISSMKCKSASVLAVEVNLKEASMQESVESEDEILPTPIFMVTKHQSQQSSERLNKN